MARYRKIDPRIWNDEKFRRLSRNAQFVFLYLLTHPHITSLGAMRASVPGLAAELRWREREFRAAFEEIAALDLVEIDDAAACLVVANFTKYNQPENPNVVKSWASIVELIPECLLRAKHLGRVARTLPEGLAEVLPEAFREGLPKPPRTPEPEPEPEEHSPSVQGNGVEPPFASFWELYPARKGLKRGKKEAEVAWRKLSHADRIAAIANVTVRLEHDGQWQRDFAADPARYLRRRSWENDEAAAEPERPYTPA